MSFRSELSHRWQTVRRIPARVPLRIKLITAVLALVAVALSIISIAGISALRGYLLGGVDATLQNQDYYDNFVRRYLFAQTKFDSPGGQLWIAYLPAGERQYQSVLEPVGGRPMSLDA